MSELIEPEVRVGHGTLTPTKIWEQKDEFAMREQRSLEEWGGLADEQRFAILSVVGRSIDRLRDRLDEWVPRALESEGGQYVDVTFRILFSELDKELQAVEEATSREIAEAKENTERLLREVSDG